MHRSLSIRQSIIDEHTRLKIVCFTEHEHKQTRLQRTYASVATSLAAILSRLEYRIRSQHHLGVTARNRSRAEIGKFDESPTGFFTGEERQESTRRDRRACYFGVTQRYRTRRDRRCIFWQPIRLNRRSMCQMLALSSYSTCPHRSGREMWK